MIKNMILSFGLLLIVGCGAQSSPDEESSSTISDASSNLVSQEENRSSVATPVESEPTLPEEDEGEASTSEDQAEPVDAADPVATEVTYDEASLLPPKVSVEFPSLLKSEMGDEDNESNETNQSIEESDLGYLQLKRSIDKIDAIIDVVEVNLNLLNHVMPEIQQRCEGMLSCIFQPQSLSLVMDNQTIAMVNQIIVERNQTLWESNESRVALGEVGFYKYDLNNSYQYMLTWDLLRSGLYHQDAQVNREFQIFKWSEDNRDVLSLYSYEDNETNNSMTLHYLIDEEAKETMHVYNQDSRERVGYQEKTSLILFKTEEENTSSSSSAYSLTSNSILKESVGEEVNTSSFSSSVEITEDESLLLFSGSIGDENSSVEVVNSEITCDNNQSCDENSSDEVHEIERELYPLRIVGGNLVDGEYVLLAPDTDIESLDLMTIFENSLGNFTVFDGERQGALHSEGFLYLLNSLIIVYINASQESTNLFEIVTLEDKPTLRIIK